jgi:serine/threonine-protein kinase
MMHASRGRRIALIGLVGSALLVSSVRPALADDATPRADNRARAQQLFDSALADAEAGNLASACPKFLASQEADPKTSTLLNLASCYEKNGQTASAWGAFREAEGLARKVGRSDWETNARSHAEALEPKLVKLTIQVPEPSRVAGLTVTRDGAKLGAGEWGVPIPVDPGDHVVSASANGRTPWETRTTVREASKTVAVPLLEVVPAVEPQEPMPRPTDRPTPASWWTPLRTTGVVLAGAGAVALVTGGVLGLVAKSNYDAARSRCIEGARGCPASAVSDADSAYGMATGATVVFAVGAVAAVTGIVLVVVSRPGEPSYRAAKPARPSAALDLGPGSIGVHGRW